MEYLFLRISQINRKTPTLLSFFRKVAELRLRSFNKYGRSRTYFPVHFEKF